LLFLPLNFINKQKKGDVSYSNIFRYSWPVLWATLTISFIANADLILVKHYFNTVDAGYYAAASFIAKIILFATTALATVMFPKVSELNSKGKDTRGILIKTLLYVTGVSIAAVGFYFISPDFVVWLLYGSKYKISNLIGLFGLAIALYSIVTTFVQYNLAVKKYCFLYFLIPLSTLEIVLIALFHSSLVMVISIIAILMAIIALAFLGYNFKDIFRIGSAQ
jgi:O-antigen/teichoic acid export membrane protein